MKKSEVNRLVVLMATVIASLTVASSSWAYTFGQLTDTVQIDTTDAGYGVPFGTTSAFTFGNLQLDSMNYASYPPAYSSTIQPGAVQATFTSGGPATGTVPTLNGTYGAAMMTDFSNFQYGEIHLVWSGLTVGQTYLYQQVGWSLPQWAPNSAKFNVDISSTPGVDASDLVAPVNAWYLYTENFVADATTINIDITNALGFVGATSMASLTPVEAVPEPSTVVLTVAGLALAGLIRRKR
jgi:hypothetical protein